MGEDNNNEPFESLEPFEPEMFEVFEMPLAMSGGSMAIANGESTTMWQCNGCAYPVFADELPSDFECPICGAARSKFVRIDL